MKAYTAPQMTVIDNLEELHIEPATLEWALDSEANQIVVTSRYERIESEDEDDEYRHFKLREEAVEVLRVDCDASEIEVVKEGVDDEGNKFKTILTKKQNVAFEISPDRYEVKDCMDLNFSGEFSIHWTDLEYYTVAFHKDGRWWFMELNPNNVGLMGYTYWDDEAGDDVEVPFSCDSIHPLNAYEPYVRGEGEHSGGESMIGSELWLICEDGDIQYGVRFDEGCGDVERINQRLEDGEVWNKIELVAGKITISTLEDEDGIKKQWLREGFYNGVYASYHRGDDYNKPFEYDVINGKILRIVQDDMLRMYQVTREYSFGTELKAEENEVMRDIKANMYGLFGLNIVERQDDYFVVKHDVTMGKRTKTQYRILCEDMYVGGIYDEAAFLGLAVDGYAPLFKVKKDGYWGVINEVGTVVVPMHFTKIVGVKNGTIEIQDKALIYELYLEEFGRKGWGYLLGDTEEEPEELEEPDFGTDGWSGFDDSFDQESQVKHCNVFVQPIPCEYECVKADTYYGVQVEKMGRVATYTLEGRLKEEFKPGRI